LETGKASPAFPVFFFGDRKFQTERESGKGNSELKLRGRNCSAEKLTAKN
jgi:hypothetical protein